MYTSRNLFSVIAIVIINIFSFNGFSQAPDYKGMMLRPNANFYHIKDSMEAYYNINPKDTLEDGPYVGYLKWCGIWQGRVNSGIGASTRGSFENAANAVKWATGNPICGGSNGASNWVSKGPRNMAKHVGGAVLSIAVDPYDVHKVYIGTYNSGLWVCSDITATSPSWVNLTDAMRWPGLGVHDILIDPNDSDIIYLATGVSRLGRYGIGVIKSIDGGLSWSTTGLNYTPTPSTRIIVHRLLMDPSNSQRIIAITDRDILETTNGGTTWPAIFSLPWNSSDRFIDLEFDQLNYGRVFICGTKLWEYYLGTVIDRTSNLTAPVSPGTHMLLSKSGNHVYIWYKPSGNNRIDKYSSGTPAWSNWAITTVDPTNSIFEVSPTNPGIVYNEYGTGQDRVLLTL